jgi:VIT1/CCC1 family predicted Fe2+/Mn2+ transporter
VNPHQRNHRNAKIRRAALRAFVWAVLAVFVLTSVGVALVNFSAR